MVSGGCLRKLMCVGELIGVEDSEILRCFDLSSNCMEKVDEGL